MKRASVMNLDELSRSVNLNNKNRSQSNNSVASNKTYNIYDNWSNKSLQVGHPGQPRHGYGHQAPKLIKQFNRQYYSTVSDRRDLSAKTEALKKKKQELNMFISGLARSGLGEKQKGSNSKKLKQNAYNILNNNNSRIKK